jgi:hypothetical protein
MSIKNALHYCLELLDIAQDTLDEDCDDLFEVAKVKLYRGEIEQLSKDPIILNCIDSRMRAQEIAEAEPVEDRGLVIISKS